MFDYLCYLDGVYVFVSGDMIIEWYCFMVICHGYDMALSNVAVL